MKTAEEKEEILLELSPELKSIMQNEGKHFPLMRTCSYCLTLLMLYATSVLLGNKYQKERLVDVKYGYLALAIFIVYSFISTFIYARHLRNIHVIKRRDGYPYTKNDLTFDNNISIIKMLICCFIVGILGGIVGIAGGIILNPFLL